MSSAAKFKLKIFVTVLILLFLFLLVWAVRLKSETNQSPLNQPAAHAMAKGSPDAPLKIIEYVDFQCHSCAIASATLHDYFEKYPSEIYVEVRPYPLVKAHLYALKSAIYASCAAKQDKFWPFQDALFARQDEWAKSDDPDAIFQTIATASEIDLQALDACVADPKTKEKIIEEKDKMSESGVKSTPTFFINGKMVVGLKEIQAELEAYFSKKDLAPR